MIGKFGIGKLATYVLANKLTYICKAPDGVVRRVTMDYSDIDRQTGAAKDRLISDLELNLYEVDQAEIEQALMSIENGPVILDLINKGVPRPEGALGEDEFGALKVQLERPVSGTWTLVVLSNLKPTGRELKMGVLRRMLQAALPFGSEMAISLNGEPLVSSKIDAPTMLEWMIGPGLDISSIELDAGDTLPADVTGATSEGDNLSSGSEAEPSEADQDSGYVRSRPRSRMLNYSGSDV